MAFGLKLRLQGWGFQLRLQAPRHHAHESRFAKAAEAHINALGMEDVRAVQNAADVHSDLEGLQPPAMTKATSNQ